MSTVVIDASVLISLWLDPDNSSVIGQRLQGTTLHAPDHLLVESSNVLRRRHNAGLLSREAADTAFSGLMSAPIRLWPFTSVATRGWQLGANVSSYDAAYIALAERLNAPLLTRDAKLSRAPGIRCAVEVL